MQRLDRVAMGARIRARRDEINLSKDDLADILGVTSKFIGDIESGARGVSIGNLMLLSQSLNVSTDYLLFGNCPKVSGQVFSHIIQNCPQSKQEALAEIISKIINSYNE